MPFNINGTLFQEDCGREAGRSPTFRYATESASEAQRSLQKIGPISDFESYQAAQALLGYNVMIEETSAISALKKRRYIRRVLPSYYPPVPDSLLRPIPSDVLTPALVDPVLDPIGRPYLWAVAVPQCEPMSGKVTALETDGTPTYEAGRRYSVTYKPLPYRVRSDLGCAALNGPLQFNTFFPVGGNPGGSVRDEGSRLANDIRESSFITRYVQGACRAVAMPNGLVRFITPGDLTGKKDMTPAGAAVLIFRALITLVWHCVPANAVPYLAIANCANKSNDGPFLGFPKGQVAFVDWSEMPYQTPWGSDEITVTYRFGYQPTGWNHFMRAHGNTFSFDEYSINGVNDDAARIVQPADFTTLFRPDQPA